MNGNLQVGILLLLILPAWILFGELCEAVILRELLGLWFVSKQFMTLESAQYIWQVNTLC